MFTKIKDGFIFIAPSKRKGKKYDVYDNKTKKYITSFGGLGYEHYFDKIGYYNNKNHLDKSRRKLYFNRHGRTNDKTSAKYFSNKYLW
jgi:hypothetical protein